MAGVEGKGETKIVTGIASRGEAVVSGGRIHVLFVNRTGPMIGQGSAQLKDGNEAFGEARIINGALRIRIT